MSNALLPTPASPITFHVPKLATKELAILRKGAGSESGVITRKLVASTNWLDQFGFTKDTRIECKVLGPMAGLEITTAPQGRLKIYERGYPHRRSNPTQRQVDIGNQTLLSQAFAGYIQRTHWTFEHGRILVRPVAERTHSIRVGLKKAASPLTAFVALSAGVDSACLRDVGFDTKALLEWRPPEKRDLSGATPRDFTETGCMTAIANGPHKYVFNENLMTVDHQRLAQTLQDEPTFGLLHISIQCDDFSNLKANSLKAKHIEDLDTSRDLTYDALRLVETVQPACLCIENVPGFMTSAEATLLRTKLRRWGYEVHETIVSAPDFGGFSGRTRYYLVATVFPGYTMPTGTAMPRAAGALWDTVVASDLAQCRDVSHTTSVQKGFETGRIRLLRPDSTVAPTVTKSQSRGTKDALYLQTADGRILAPTERMLQRINGIPDTFRFDATSAELAVEQIGQSIDWPMHHAVVSAVKEHLLTNWRLLDLGRLNRGEAETVIAQAKGATLARAAETLLPTPLPTTGRPGHAQPTLFD